MRSNHLEVVRLLLLRKLDRIAIWNNEKGIILIAIGVWLADIAFLIHGEYVPSPIIEVFSHKPGGIPGSVQVKFSTLTNLDLLGLFINLRSVFRGRMNLTLASCSTQGA